MEIRFFAGAAEAAGADTRQVNAEGLTAADLVGSLSDGNERLGRVLAVSSLLADGTRLATLEVDVSSVQRLDVLPPFAGG